MILYSCQEVWHKCGVGFILSKEAAGALIRWKPIGDRIITARFRYGHVKATVVQVYAPMDSSEDTVKNDFYDQLQDVFDDIPNHNLKILIGDLNAEVGGDRLGYEGVIGAHASSTWLSDNGEWLVLFCEHNGLCIGNKYFQHERIHKKTWRSPDGCTFKEIDFKCISQKLRSSLCDARAYLKGDVGFDHYLVRGEMKLKLRNQKNPNQGDHSQLKNSRTGPMPTPSPWNCESDLPSSKRQRRLMKHGKA
uniref:Craniofacial development protein 2-like n=1 Tax=Romanomermis culicivorax TaxID=13658 RepID=A0A915J2K9_ROMCU